MHYCLTKLEVEELLNHTITDKPITESDLETYVELSKCWSYELIGFNYFLAQIIERKLKRDENPQPFISAFYELESQMYFNIQDLGNDFLDFMLHNLSDRSLTLEERLIDIQQRLSEYAFSSGVRV